LETLNLSFHQVKSEHFFPNFSQVHFLKEYADVFAWSFQDMPGLDTYIFVHELPLKPGWKPFKPSQNWEEWSLFLKIQEEVMKRQLDAGFLHTSSNNSRVGSPCGYSSKEEWPGSDVRWI
jgi:hypothetical protein